MGMKPVFLKYGLPAISIIMIAILVVVCWEPIARLYCFISDRELVKVYIASYGVAAPAVFIFVQILQVIFAPIPGEATGFVGGYLFGTTLGFFYSTIGLGVGSGLNFCIGRLAGVKFVRKIVSGKRMKKYDNFFEKQGTIVLLLLFVFPGFPKDILSVLSGLSSIPFKTFILIATIGRMPGTFLLSLQGEFLFNKNYGVLVLSTLVCAILSLVCLKYREEIYLWLEKNE